MTFFKKLSHMSLSGLGNMLLTTTAIGVAGTGVILMGMYIIKYAKETPEMVTLQCAVGVSRPDCPTYQEALKDAQAALDAAQAERQRLADEVSAIKDMLEALDRVEHGVDSVTLFSMKALRGTSHRLNIGTVCSSLTRPSSDPTYYCYIELGKINGIQRQLNIRDATGDVPVSQTQLLESGVSSDTLQHAREQCKPYLIGG